MSLKLGGSSSKSSSTSTSNSNSSSNFNTTTTPLVPDWASNLTQGAASRVSDLTHIDPQSLVAPAQTLQTQAGQGAANLTGSPAAFGTATDLTRQAANTDWTQPYLTGDTPFASGGKAYTWLNNYENPYQHDVVNSAANDFDAYAGQVRAREALDLAGSGAFGGSGAALTQSMTEGELARARASTLAGLQSQGFQTALNAASGDAERATQARINNAQLALQDRFQKAGLQLQARQQQLQAASQLAGLSSAYEANQRANIGTQAQVGDMLRGIDQQSISAPVTSTQQIVALLSGLPIQLFTGQQQSGTQTGTNTTNASGTQKGSSLSFEASKTFQ